MKFVIFMLLQFVVFNLFSQKTHLIHLNDFNNGNKTKTQFFFKQCNIQKEALPVKIKLEHYLEFEFKDSFIDLEISYMVEDSVIKSKRFILLEDYKDKLELSFKNDIITHSLDFVDFKIYNDNLVKYSKEELGFLKKQYLPFQGQSISYDSTLIVKERIKSAKKKYEKKQLEFIKLYPLKFESLLQLELIVKRSKYIENNLYIETFKTLDYIIQNTKCGISLSKEIEKKTEMFEKLPKVLKKNQVILNVNSLNNETINLENYQGKKILLNFWATWCKPCVEEMPSIKKIIEKYPEIVIIGLSEDKDLTILKKFINHNEIKWPQIQINTEFKHKFNVDAIPTTIYINENGITMAIHIGGLTFNMIERIINQ